MGSSPIQVAKHEMIGSNPRRAVRNEDPTLTTGKDSISLNNVLVAQLVEHAVEAHGVGGSNPPQHTKQNM